MITTPGEVEVTTGRVRVHFGDIEFLAEGNGERQVGAYNAPSVEQVRLAYQMAASTEVLAVMKYFKESMMICGALLERDAMHQRIMEVIKMTEAPV